MHKTEFYKLLKKAQLGDETSLLIIINKIKPLIMKQSIVYKSASKYEYDEDLQNNLIEYVIKFIRNTSDVATMFAKDIIVLDKKL